MSTFTGKSAIIPMPVEQVYERTSDFSLFQKKLETLPTEAREKLGDVKFDTDSITINTPPVGEIRFAVTQRHAPDMIRLEAEQSPVPFAITICLTSLEADRTEVTPKIEVEIPAMLKPLVGGKLQEAADRFGDMLGTFTAS